MTIAEWERGVPECIKQDTLWRVKAYRLASYIRSLAWQDAQCMSRDRRLRDCVSQMYRAVGSISANLSEGYSRNTGKERARFYEFALGSARESRDWYVAGEHTLERATFLARLELLTEISRLTMTMIPDQRRENQSLSATPKRSTKPFT
jgi:four helix bundle protein